MDMERIISSFISFIILILTLAVVLPALLAYPSPSSEDGLTECMVLLGDAVENGWLITLISISPDEATLLINGTIEIKLYVIDGELMCTEVASPI